MVLITRSNLKHYLQGEVGSCFSQEKSKTKFLSQNLDSIYWCHFLLSQHNNAFHYDCMSLASIMVPVGVCRLQSWRQWVSVTCNLGTSGCLPPAILAPVGVSRLQSWHQWVCVTCNLGFCMCLSPLSCSEYVCLNISKFTEFLVKNISRILLAKKKKSLY